MLRYSLVRSVSAFRGPIPFSCVRENGMGALHQHGRHKRAPDFSEALRGCLCLLEQLLLDFGNLDIDAFVHKVDKVEQDGHVRHAEKVVFAVAVLY